MKNRAMLPLIKERHIVLAHLSDMNDSMYPFPLELQVKQDLLNAQFDNFQTDQEILGIYEEISVKEFDPPIPLFRGEVEE